MASPNRSTTRSKAKRPSRSTPDAIQMLKDDHAHVKALFAKFEKASAPRDKQSLAAQICDELTLHAEAEETIFYPAVREEIEDEEIMNEADVEHDGAKTLIGRIRNSRPADEHFDAMVSVLSEAIKHHVKEEEGEMFKQVRRTDLDLEELGERLQEFKQSHGKEPRH